MLRGSSCRMAVLAVLCALPVSACAGSGVKTDSAPAPAQVPTPPAATADPRAQPALTAYAAFSKAAITAQMKPYGFGEEPPGGANFLPYSFDPLRAETAGFVLNLASSGMAMRGSPPRSHVRVKDVDLSAKPYPAVTLTDCESSGPDWRPQLVKSGTPVPTVTPSGSSAPPPYLETYTVIYFQKHWGVQSVTLDVSQTCSA